MLSVCRVNHAKHCARRVQGFLSCSRIYRSNTEFNCVRQMSIRRVSILIFGDCFEGTDFNYILLFAVTGLSSIVVLTQNGQYLNCVTIAFSERYVYHWALKLKVSNKTT